MLPHLKLLLIHTHKKSNERGKKLLKLSNFFSSFEMLVYRALLLIEMTKKCISK